MHEGKPRRGLLLYESSYTYLESMKDCEEGAFYGVGSSGLKKLESSPSKDPVELPTAIKAVRSPEFDIS